ncbi:MAG: hypothetical protein PF448_14425 [Bacteroidales bacterium]|jgi:hypothetical protein|nr:hypothetical protein [Bacteroidales bacterium]
MKKLSILIVVALGVLVACQSPKQPDNQEVKGFSHLKGYQTDSIYDSVAGVYVEIEKISFGNNLSFQLDSMETEGEIDSSIIEKYFLYNDLPTAQIPLNRYVVSENYELFIGMIIGKSITDLAQVYETNDTAFLEMIETEKVIRLLNHHDSLYSVRYLIKKNQNYLFSFVSKDSAFIYEKFQNNETPANRIF